MCTFVYIIMSAAPNYNMYREEKRMDSFKLDTSETKMSSVSRTIRMKEETFDRICEINRKTGVSFNRIVNQCIEYALERYEEAPEE